MQAKARRVIAPRIPATTRNGRLPDPAGGGVASGAPCSLSKFSKAITFSLSKDPTILVSVFFKVAIAVYSTMKARIWQQG
jgi:hypothetical protein